MLLVASFFSGVAALNYELLWVREFALIAGSTQAAISVVLAVYFLGLSIGNILAGAFARRISRPMLAYIGLEAVIGVWALAFFAIMGVVASFYSSYYTSLAAGSDWLHGLRAGTAAAILLIPTTCMGATLPLLVQFGAYESASVSRWSAWLYGLNTLGAMTGVGLTGFVLVEHVGVAQSLLGTSILNLACILCVLPWANRRVAAGGASDTVASPDVAVVPEDNARRVVGGGVLVLTFGALGVFNIAAEVLWTRFYALIYLNDTYMFSTVLLLYLFGVSVGSLLGGWADRVSNSPMRLMGLLQIVSATWTVVMIYLVPGLVLQAQLLVSDSLLVMVLQYIVAVGAGVLVPTLCMGATFPLLVKLVARRPEYSGAWVGRALASNTIGGVFGAFIGGYLLLEYTGLERGLYIVATGTALIGIVYYIWSDGVGGMLRSNVKWAIIGSVVVVMLSPPALERGLLGMHLGDVDEPEILSLEPSVHGMTAVTEDKKGERLLWVNSTWIGGSGTGWVSGYAPWLFHQRPIDKALGLCMGSAGSFGALFHAADCPLDLVEINTAVVDASRTWFDKLNNGVLSDERTNVFIDDARHYVRYSDKQYDLITIEPMQPFQRGAAYFYTREFYREVKARMNENAIICHYVPIALGIDVAEFKSIVATFVEEFPNAILWGPGPYTVVIAYQGDFTTRDLDVDKVFERMRTERLQAAFEFIRLMGPKDALAFALLDGDGLREFSSGASIYLDDKPALEFTAARREGTLGKNFEAIQSHLTPINDMFAVRDRGLLRDLEQLRSLHLELSIQGDEDPSLVRRIVALSKRLNK